MREEPMSKNDKDLPKHVLDELADLENMREEDIDLSDIPERQDFSGGARGKFYRPVKKQVTLRIDADILEWFKGVQRGGYQTRINAALRSFVEQQDRKAG